MSWQSDAHVVGLKCGRSGAGRNEKLVLHYLSNRYNSDFQMAWVSDGRIAEECGLSLRGLKYVLGRLVGKGFVERVRGNGRGRVSLYRFPGMLTEAERMNAKSLFARRLRPEKGANAAPFIAGKGANAAPFCAKKRVQSQHRNKEPSLLELTESFLLGLAEKAKPIQRPVEKSRAAKTGENRVEPLQRVQKAGLAPTTSAPLPEEELARLAADLSELALVRRAQLRPLEVARCLVQAARSQVPDATLGGILAAAMEASRGPEGYQVRSPMKWLMRRVSDRYRSLALYPEGRRPSAQEREERRLE